MNEEEKERLIKKDIVSIENKVRHAFNQGYEMGMKDREKLNCTDCIIEKSGDFIKSCSEILNTCGDAISRQAVLDIITFEDKWLLDAKSHNADTKIAFSSIKSKISEMPSVTPQQRTGRWIKQNYGWNWQCSECGFVTPPSAKEIFTFCPKCGARMEVEDAD